MKGDRIRKNAMEQIWGILTDLKKPTVREQKILKEALDFVNYVRSFGNQCAWTDRCCENVINLGEGLQLSSLNKWGKTIEPYFEKNYQERYDYWIERLKKVI